MLTSRQGMEDEREGGIRWDTSCQSNQLLIDVSVEWVELINA